MGYSGEWYGLRSEYHGEGSRIVNSIGMGSGIEVSVVVGGKRAFSLPSYQNLQNSPSKGCDSASHLDHLVDCRHVDVEFCNVTRYRLVNGVIMPVSGKKGHLVITSAMVSIAMAPMTSLEIATLGSFSFALILLKVSPFCWKKSGDPLILLSPLKASRCAAARFIVAMKSPASCKAIWVQRIWKGLMALLVPLSEGSLSIASTPKTRPKLATLVDRL